MTETIPWWEPKLGDRERQAMLAVYDQGFINDGPATRALEARVASITGTRFASAMSNCTSALAVSLMAAGVGPGDEVIVPDVTFIASANAVRLAGAEVRLVDVEPERLTLDVELTRQAITKRTKAVMPVDFNGRSADYQALESLCRDHGLALISDSAEALGSVSEGRALGSYGLAGCYSFSGNKMFFSGQGGMIVGNDEGFFQRVRDLRDHAKRDGGPFGDMAHPHVGFNFKFPSLLAALLLSQLDEIDARLAHARQRDRWFQDMLGNLPGVSFLPGREGEVCLWADAFFDNQERVVAALHKAGVGYRKFWRPLHQQPPYQQPDDAFPNAISSWKKGVWLPSALSLTEEQAAFAAKVIREALT
jgi:perosamine synthetase